MFTEIKMMTYFNCRNLVDVLIGVHGDWDIVPGIYFQDIGRCPRRRETDLKVRTESRLCAKCGAAMDEGEATALWD